MEIDYKKLEELGITNDGKKKQFCPSCHKDRKNHPTEKELSVDWNKCIAHCHHCGENFFNKADFGIAIERDRMQGVTRVHVQKVKFRHLGQPGVASFCYNTHNGRFVPCIEGKTPDIPNEVKFWDNSNWLGKKLPKQGELEL